MESGFAESDEEEAELKRLATEHARQRIALVDHTKFDAVSFIKICDVDGVNAILTDTQPSEAWTHFVRSHNVKLQIAEQELPDFHLSIQTENLEHKE